MYPQNKTALAKILVDNSYGAITLKELLTYVNGGSNEVSRELYNYLASAGMLNGTAQNNYASKPKENKTKTSLWSRIVGFFQKLFGKSENTEIASSPSSSVVGMGQDEAIYNRYTDGTISISQSVSAPVTSGTPVAPSYTSEADQIEAAQIEYNRYYAEYQSLVSSANPDRQKVLEASVKMNVAKKKLDNLKGNK